MMITHKWTSLFTSCVTSSRFWSEIESDSFIHIGLKNVVYVDVENVAKAKNVEISISKILRDRFFKLSLPQSLFDKFSN